MGWGVGVAWGGLVGGGEGWSGGGGGGGVGAADPHSVGFLWM